MEDMTSKSQFDDNIDNIDTDLLNDASSNELNLNIIETNQSAQQSADEKTNSENEQNEISTLESSTDDFKELSLMNCGAFFSDTKSNNHHGHVVSSHFTSHVNHNSNSHTIYGYNRYTEIELGNLNILISVPHDGSLKPAGIKDRQLDDHGNFKGDYNTRRFGQILRDELSLLFLVKKHIKVKPFIIFNNLHRIKMDPNRDPSSGCYSFKEESAIAYKDYHTMIDTYFANGFLLNEQTPYENGLLIDVHGQAHHENWIELGYLLSSHDLEKDLYSSSAKKSSLHKLASSSKYKFENLIRGKHASLGGIIEKHFGLRVVPSPSFPSPNGGNYYSGGYITERYTSKEFAKYRLNAIQIELPSSMRDDIVYELYAKKIAYSIFEFYFIHSFDRLLTNG